MSLMLFLSILCLTLTPPTVSSTPIDLASPDPASVITIKGEMPGDLFGFSVNTAGDINNDNIPDFIIGAYKADNPTTVDNNKGGAYIILGQANGLTDIDLASGLTDTTGFKIKGNYLNSAFGWSVAGLGDINQDGFSDFIIGGEHTNLTSVSRLDAGCAYLIYGKATGLSSTDLSSFPATDGIKYYAARAKDLFGSSVSSAGDINGDGILDFVIGATKAGPVATPTSYPGAVYIVFGNNNLAFTDFNTGFASSTDGFKIQGPDNNSQFGVTVSYAGDINDDGISDIIIGAPSFDSFGVTDAGAAYIILGKKSSTISDIDLATDLNNPQVIRIFGASTGGLLGTSVAYAGDINGDNVDDVIIGAPGVGIVYVIFGKKGGFSDITLDSGFSKTQGFRIQGATAADQLGNTVAGVGDINGDGVDDALVSAPYADPLGRTDAGIVYAIYGSKKTLTDIQVASLTSNQGFQVYGSETNGYLGEGSGISGVGDVNGDGANDIVIGNSGASPSGRTQAGSAYVIFGTEILGADTIITAAQVLSAIQQVSDILALGISAIKFGMPLALWFSCLSEILKYVRYLEITCSTRLQLLLEQPDFELFSINYLSAAPDEVVNNLKDYSIPDKFAKNGISSSFLINFWPSLTFLSMTVIVLILASLLCWMTTNCKSLNSVARYIKDAVKWNYLIANFTGFYGDIALFTVFEITTVQFSSILEYLSFFIAVSANVLVIVVLVVMSFVIMKIAQKRVESQRNRGFKQITALKKHYKDYEVVFSCFKNGSFWVQGYMIFFSIRLYLFNIILGYLSDYPLVQTGIITTMGFVILLYLVIKRPFKEKLDFVSNLIQEIILQVVNISALILAILDQAGIEDIGDGRRVVAGDIIVVCNFAFPAFGVIYLLIITIITMKDIFVFAKQKCRKQEVSSSRQRCQNESNQSFGRGSHLDLSRSNLSPGSIVQNTDGIIMQNESNHYSRNVVIKPEASFSRRNQHTLRFRDEILARPIQSDYRISRNETSRIRSRRTQN